MTTSQENGELTARVEQLEAQVVAVEAYLGNQAKSAEAMEVALAASEQAGFAYGINPESRRILLEAWRARAKAVASEVPGQKDKQADASGQANRRDLVKK